jgi:membrane protein required for colicin V production
VRYTAIPQQDFWKQHFSPWVEQAAEAVLPYLPAASWPSM